MRLQKLLMQTDVVLLDFQKAFDEVQHERLIDKLHHYGIQGNTNAWIRSLHIIITVQIILFLFRLGELKILRTQFDIDLEQRKDLARPWRNFLKKT